MIKDITIGQYYPADSAVHRLDPRVKLVGTLVFIVSLFTFHSFSGYLVVLLFLFGLVRMSKVPFSYMVKGLKPILFLLFIMVGFNLFLTPGDPVFQFKFIEITKQGIRLALFMAIRLILLILGSSLMTFTTTPNQLTDGLESLLGPLKKIRVPVHEIAMMMSIALRFIPILLEEADKIMKAQQARGLDIGTGGLIRRAKGMIPLLVPLFVSAFRRANDLAMAMEARCYNGGEGRTKMKPLVYGGRDYLAFLAQAGYLGAVIVISRAVYF